MKSFLNSEVLRQSPARGTAIFACLYAALTVALDWLFRWELGDHTMPPLWTVLVTIGIETAIFSLVVYLLLVSVRRQHQAVEELNHEMRNAMQVLSYAVRQCDADTAPKAEAAIQSMSGTLRRVSQRLGLVSERKWRPEK